ncbi:AraC family transcriptional regulator [Lacrimispora sp. NSJ-141]|uniref:AraC family transcriptional regulator n=1 Tax=Lientehia hominis TaxID=2897778 RepID=A0AAP2RFM8_9FIRM|nr:helix-turn-helix domain-containing protein [Lientehia hominis]MCD2491339.1 AraC family transcriptional regulator [Lientehia hominis]
MNKRIIFIDKNQRELNRTLSGSFPVCVEHELLSDFIKRTVLHHWHPELEMAAVLQGSVICQINGVSRRLEKGTGIFINTNVLHGYLPDGEQDCIYEAIRFEPSLLGQPGSCIYENQIAPVLSSADLSSVLLSKNTGWQKEFLTAIEEIGNLEQEKSSCLELKILERLARIWQLLYENTMEPALQTPQSAKDIARMKRAITFVQNSCHSTVTLNDIAGSCSLSQSECCRLFKRILHQSPMEYVITCRINKSLPLLAEGTLSITEIAGLTGFQSSSYFTETFRRMTGVTPSQYRKQAALSLTRI